ncbi:hypothetical protein F2Q68_00017130 [Brassica cretica]|uniref:Uncharacterized protein n=1 Tax=Brassica cretica TaxID=69181 RepID=A0A8S9HJS1_BRACR|nr:hypothetical protein F2Q68_00017130 [Brassica cretica]
MQHYLRSIPIIKRIHKVKQYLERSFRFAAFPTKKEDAPGNAIIKAVSSSQRQRRNESVSGLYFDNGKLKVESKTLAERREVLVQGGAAETQEKSLKGSEATDEEHQRENVLSKSQGNKK